VLPGREAGPRTWTPTSSNCSLTCAPTPHGSTASPTMTGFAKMMIKRAGEQELPGWLEGVEANGQPEPHTFAAGIRQDLAAETAGFTVP
jgi:hypothetical protein